jgi:hypothetical protein
MAMQTPRGRVTPDHVGRRVSFQYELPNGWVGEVVGTLEWFDEAADTFMVKDRNERLHRVPAKGVRYSKVIPQRAEPGAPLG